MPSPGRLLDSRLSVTSVSAYSVSPWNSGLGNATSLKPRLPTMVPCVSCATDSPTRVDSVNIEFTRRWWNGGNASENAASRCSAWVFMVSVVKKTLSASVMVRPGRCW